MDTLQQSSIPYRHVEVQKPSTDTEFNLLDLMCVDVARVLMRQYAVSVRQCGREYGFATGDLCGENGRATQLHLLSTEELVQLPTSNIPAERHRAAFGQKALLLTSKTKNFKAKAIRNDMVLYQSTPFSNPGKAKNFHVVVQLLNDIELLWTDDQKGLQKAKILEKMMKAKNTAKYTQKMLQTCKSLGGRGPVTSIEELQLMVIVRKRSYEPNFRTTGTQTSQRS